MPKAKTLFFTAPRKIEIREIPLPGLKEDEVLVETICSAISAGTEMLVYRGQFPHLADAHDNVSSDLNYPLAYGYACVGRVVEIGKVVNRELVEQVGLCISSTCFILHHSTHSSLILIPDSLNPRNRLLPSQHGNRCEFSPGWRANIRRAGSWCWVRVWWGC